MRKPLAILAVMLALTATSASAKPKQAPGLDAVAVKAAEVVKGRLPPAATVVTVAALGREDPAFTPLLERALRNAGFAVAVDAQSDRRAEIVRYDVLPVQEGVVLGLEFAGERTTRLLRQTDNGSMALAGPVIVKEVD